MRAGHAREGVCAVFFGLRTGAGGKGLACGFVLAKIPVGPSDILQGETVEEFEKEKHCNRSTA